MAINAISNASTAVPTQTEVKKATNDVAKDDNVRTATPSKNTQGEQDNTDKNIKKVVEAQKQESRPAINKAIDKFV